MDNSNLCSTLHTMTANIRIIVREEVWAALSGMGEPDMPFSKLI